MEQQAIIDTTRRWISSVVIGLNLCPFARAPFETEKIRYVVSDATTTTGLLRDLKAEIQLLEATPITAVETTLLIHPYVLGAFLDYNEFLDDAEGLLEELGQEGIVQIATFHPAYQFEGAGTEAVENYTNRSPYPMLHLLREASISALPDDADELEAIPHRNIETLKKMGLKKIRAKLKAIRANTEQEG